MRTRTILAAPLIAGAALVLAGCGSGGDGDNAIDNVAGNGLENAADPMAVETMYNGGDAGTSLDASGNGAADGNAANTGAPTANGAETAVPPPSRGTNVGGDAGGNAAGGTTNGM